MNRDSKLCKLRDKMKIAGVSAVIIPSTDPHSSEYVHKHWKIREWFSGFRGSAGTLVVTMEKSGLWTDFRYYIEAEEALRGSEISLYRDGLPETPSIFDFLKENLGSGDIAAIDGTLLSVKNYKTYINELKDSGIILNTYFDSTDGIWENRPLKPDSRVWDFSIEYCGESREDKIKRVRESMKEMNIDYYVISSLSDIAWVLNIRGADVDFTPLVISYIVISLSDIEFFVDTLKLDSSITEVLEESSVKINDYDSIGNYLAKIKNPSTLYYNPDSLNCYLAEVIPDSVKIASGKDVISEFKSEKNHVEINNLKASMEMDGVALVRFYRKFEEEYRDRIFTEFSLSRMIREFRLEIDGCTDESFAPIVAFKGNGALCHYSASEDGSKRITGSGLLLIDSGGQYLTGTTDITRTISIGRASAEEIMHYTLVLKGHIALSRAIFPEGTTGGQLDILARAPLWEKGLNYGHGTGHGVGFFLGVHEGPQNISPKSFNTPLRAGMVTSNEPGIYIEGSHGIRTENLILTKFSKKGLYQNFLEFETLTLYPYDLTLIDKSILSRDEIEWINDYHNMVVIRLEKYLTGDELNWLKDKCHEI